LERRPRGKPRRVLAFCQDRIDVDFRSPFYLRRDVILGHFFVDLKNGTILNPFLGFAEHQQPYMLSRVAVGDKQWGTDEK
jgi:hypothetical protein